MSICPEAEYRKGLGDVDFWHYVLTGTKPEEDREYDFLEPDQDSDCSDVYNPRIGQPCPVCRSTGACGYDSEGRPMIHTVEDSEDES